MRLVVPLQPLAPLAVTAVYRVLQRSADHLVLAADGDGGGLGRTLVIEALSDRWLVQHWPELLTRSFNRPAYAEIWGPEEIVAAVFGFDEQSVIQGAGDASNFLGRSRIPAPAQCVNLPFVRTYGGLDACLLRCGCVPHDMDDRWFIHREGGRLVFRRSWTGFIIYAVTFEDADGAFLMRQVAINRDPEQYGETDDAHDLRLLERLIDGLLLGKNVEFPMQSDDPPTA